MPDKKAKRYRGPSRPVDPRYAPGPTVRRGPDTFGMTLIGVSAAFVLIIILWAALANGGNTGTTTGVTSQVTTVSTDPTAQAATVATQEVIDLTQTAVLPRIEPKDAIDLVNAGNATIVDVRTRDQYTAGHIKGATNIPESESSNRLAEFPKSGNLIIYCQ